MARISAVEKERKKRIYDAVIFNIFINEGWEYITYERLSTELDVRKSTLQGYYPTRAHFSTALQDKVLPLMIEKLNFANKDAFIDSWQQALMEKRFLMVIRMFIGSALSPETSNGTRQSLNHLQREMQRTMSQEEADSAIRAVMGDSMVFIINQ
ncbi:MULTISPECIES: hypothetical protein [Vibrio]|uniref:HTH tetR-type domain-containing protein n=1 Tax=Vibrio proteolyticus NBRC 13287 TaxID=1219065 RepID=U3A3D7_VIBPR|nr:MULTISPECIES: hypothetical protein [Vibrio]NAX21219.1 hypothetical protein [Vibrio sp. V39_P1S14PM300]GAD68210.1 hypothetical protein VPR01S_12_00190 [Vibrio proteolyticus NBRC 13287]